MEIASILRTIVMDQGRTVADGWVMEILDYEGPFTVHGLEKPPQITISFVSSIATGGGI